MDLSSELALAEKLVRKAGSMALDLRNQLVITEKPHGQGPVTNADILIGRYLCQEIATAYPKDRIVSEESFSDNEPEIGDGRIWFIDPIDGTSSYVLGNDDFVVMIGLVIGGIPRMGVIFQPVYNLLWRAIFTGTDDGYAEKISNNQPPHHLVSRSEIPHDLRLIASRTHRSRKQDALIKLLHPKTVIFRSSIGLKAMMILDQRADLYVAWSKHIKMWDTCAASAVILAAQGHISFIDGQSLTFNGPINHNGPILMANFKPNHALINTLALIDKSI
jgi:3'(2'), 5'-bisphosphate nucleotidase